MSDRQTGAPGSSIRKPTTFFLISILLIGSFLWRAFTPADEYPMRTEQVMTMGLDLLLIVGLIGLRARAPNWKPLFWIALVAGVGMFVIRLTSDASWWTGHIVYSLGRR